MGVVSRRLGIAAALICASALTVGCAPGADPTPAPTSAFASEEEAFAAAEKTYRAYVDALNDVDLSDPATFEDVYQWETGEAEEADKKNLTRYHAEGNSIEGDTVVRQLSKHEVSGSFRAVTIYGCLDVSTVVLRNREGQSLVSDDRNPIQSVLVTLASAPASSTGMLVSKISGRTEGPAC